MRRQPVMPGQFHGDRGVELAARAHYYFLDSAGLELIAGSGGCSKTAPAGRGLCLTLEPAQCLRIRGDFVGQEF
jgi:hypothetical protein